MRRFVLDAEQLLPRPLGEVFAFFSDPGNLQRITPPWLGFEIIGGHDSQMRAGLLIDYRLRIHGLPVRWQSEITIWDPPRRFVDEQRRGLTGSGSTNTHSRPEETALSSGIACNMRSLAGCWYRSISSRETSAGLSRSDGRGWRRFSQPTDTHEAIAAGLRRGNRRQTCSLPTGPISSVPLASTSGPLTTSSSILPLPGT